MFAMASLTPRYYPPKAPLWQGLLFLSLLCALFYAALNYYAGNALNSIAEVQALTANGQQLSFAAMQRLLALRALFSLLFCLLLGVFGTRITGKIWTGALVHAAAVLIMLWQDVPQELLLAHWQLALGLAAVVGLLTLFSSVVARWKSGRRKPTLGWRR